MTTNPKTSNDNSVLIATDFTKSSDAATLHGFKTASLWGVSPHIAHVCQRSNNLMSIDDRGERLLLTADKANTYVAEHVERLLQYYRESQGEPGFDVALSHLLVGDPAESIVRLAKELQVSLVITGTSKHEGAKRWLMGSTAERIVRIAECPVMVYRAPQTPPEQTLEAACPACVQVRRESEGRRIWCPQHQEAQERRHTYHYRDKNSRVRENMPLLFPMQ